MFWGWWSFGEGGVRRSSGCFFLPLIFICGSFFVFDNFRAGWLLPLVGLGLAWLLLLRGFTPGAGQNPHREWGEAFEDEKPKRDADAEKPKRDSDYLYRDDGDILEVVDPPEETDPRSDEDRPL